MSKSLKVGINILSVFLYVSVFAVVLSVFEPIGYLLNIFGGNMAKQIVGDSDYLVLLHHTHVSHAIIANFPSGTYNGLMTIGLGLAVAAGIIALWAGIQLLSAIAHQHYFSMDNVKQLRRFLIAQALAMFGDIFLASANTLTRLILYRVNSDYSVDWGTPAQDLIILIIIGLIYFIYRKAVLLKQENELTI